MAITDKAENADKLDVDNKNRVVITPEDVQECSKFLQFFEIPVPDELQRAITAFEKDPTFQHQEELRFEVAAIIVSSMHPVFRDEVFNQVRPETAEIYEGLVFERQLEEQLTSKVDE